MKSYKSKQVVKRRSNRGRKSNQRKKSNRGKSGCSSGGKKLKLLSIKRSPKKDKKLVATFCRSGRIKQTHFGAKGMSDFTIHKDKARMERYKNRHSRRENWNDPTSAGALSRWVLWNKPSLRGSIADYKRRFNL